jgi:predicted AAA+ superfamily ATPase
MVFESSGSELSLRKIAGVTGLSGDTVGSYLQAAEDAYLIFGCPYFSYSSRKQRVRNKKFYPIDPGLRRAVINVSERDFGKDLELVSYLALRKAFNDVYYWRDNLEVDFVVIVQGHPLPIQVTWDTPKERHERALKEFYERFPEAHEALFLGRKDIEENFAVLEKYR